jgi:hypothetical protein
MVSRSKRFRASGTVFNMQITVSQVQQPMLILASILFRGIKPGLISNLHRDGGYRSLTPLRKRISRFLVLEAIGYLQSLDILKVLMKVEMWR